jgi:hypothetical protein
MSNPIKLTFQFSDGTSHDASLTEASISQAICYKYGWSIAPIVAGLDSTPTYTIQVSNNNVDFFPYDLQTVDALIGQAFDDTHLDWLYVRINYDAQLNTTGTVEFPLILK